MRRTLDDAYCDVPLDELDDLAFTDAATAYKTPGYETWNDLRSMPYDRYLKTTHWQITRKRALLRAGSQCQFCEATDHLNVHHLTYRRRAREKESDIIVLCFRCHEWVHANPHREVVLRWVNLPRAKIIIQDDATAAVWAQHFEPPKPDA